MNKSSGVRFIKGVGEKNEEKLSRLGVETLYDLVHFYPRSYIDFSNTTEIKDIVPENPCCFKATVGSPCSKDIIRQGMTIFKTEVFDETGIVSLIFFNSEYTANRLEVGKEYIFYGKVKLKMGRLQMDSPLFISSDSDELINPIYPLTKDLSNKVLSNIIKNALNSYFSLNLPDIIPDGIRQKFELCHEHFALKNIHFPENSMNYEIAKKRLIFEELFLLQLGMRLIKSRDKGKTTAVIKEDFSKEFSSFLNFELTSAQTLAIADCAADMKKDEPMNRLIEGDVGSGKTVVAISLIYTAVKNGYQAAFMAPTEILALQHFENISALLKDKGIKAELLTGSISKKKKQEIKDRISSGETQIAIGTHALLTEDTVFKNLGLIVTDEQHRFGVKQRGSLFHKGQNPHTLVMSATPIPRTLSLIIYGDLDLTIIDEMPKSRQKISTFCVDSSYHKRIFAFIKKHLDEGLQAYIVCPLVEEGDNSDLTSAVEFSKKLQKEEFKDYSVGILHGKMKPSEKDKIMSDFKKGKINLLVSTTVIEVGVDVPNAVIMMIQNAERFGLSQLHQLRGRVGRGSDKSYCILINDQKGENAKKRMEIMCKTQSGFKIAEKDLELRGPGDFFGQRQSGLPELKIASLTENMDAVRDAKKAGELLLRDDPHLEKRENEELRKRIKELFNFKNNISLN